MDQPLLCRFLSRYKHVWWLGFKLGHSEIGGSVFWQVKGILKWISAGCWHYLWEKLCDEWFRCEI